MKTRFPNPVLLPVLLVGFGSIGTSQATAQTFTTLRSFTAISASSPYTNADGQKPNAALLLSGNRLYGIAKNGGRWGNGTVFALNTDGTGFTNLHTFAATSGGSLPNFANLEGINPQSDLILSGNTLYGTAPYGGTNGNGTVFAVNIDGTGFINLHTFTSGPGANKDGASPFGGLVLFSNTLFGTASAGGNYGNGTVFAVSTDGTGFTNLHSFNVSEGAAPFGGLVLSGKTLFGTTADGGPSADGTVFAVSTDGSTFTNLHSFTGRDGASPFAGLILSANTLYGTTEGSSIGYGAVFAVSTDGRSFTNLHTFNRSEGWEPQGRLFLSGNTLYGTATYGGIGQNGNGTLFAIKTDGTGFTNLHKFTATAGSEGGYGVNMDGGYPVGGLILSGNTLFGTTHMGGASGTGTIFTLSFTPQLTLVPSGSNLVFAWPTNYAGFDYTGYTLQSTADLSSSAAWSTSSAPVVVNGQYAVTNPISGAEQFFQVEAVSLSVLIQLRFAISLGKTALESIEEFECAQLFRGSLRDSSHPQLNRRTGHGPFPRGPNRVIMRHRPSTPQRSMPKGNSIQRKQARLEPLGTVRGAVGTASRCAT